MILVIGSFNGNDFELRQNLYNFCAALCTQSLPHACIIEYPETAEERTWLQPFIYALKSAGVQRVNLLFSTKNFNPAELPVIEAMGISEIIFIEENPDIHFINAPAIGVRVWLTNDNDGRNHEKTCHWNAFVNNLLCVEPVPAVLMQALRSEPPVDTPVYKHGEPCTADYAMVVISGKAQADEVCTLPTFFEQWKNRLPFNMYCGNCGPYALSEWPGWLFNPDQRFQKAGKDEYFFDYVKGNLAKMSARKTAIIKKEFFERVQQSATKNH